MKKINLGLIGCGLGAGALYGSFFDYLENGRLIACMDIDKKRAEILKKQTGAAYLYTDLDEMLANDEIDAVIVVTPTNYHAEQVVKAAEAGKHVFCEKPMAPTIEEADQMIDACNHYNVRLQIALMKRFNNSFLKVKEIVDSGRLGDIFELRAIWDNARTRASAEGNYRHRLISGGGYLQEDGSHPIDICRWFMGEVDSVSGHVMLVAGNRFENDDLDLVVMKHRNGSMSSLHITMLTHRRGLESYEIFGTKATLLMEWKFHSTHSLEPGIIKIYENAGQVTDVTLETSWNPHEELIDNWQYLNELRHFCDCILYDKTPRVGGDDGRAAVEIINAAYLSAMLNKTVKLPLESSPDLNSLFTRLQKESKWQIKDQDAWWSRY
ncbi:hypothetical protein GF407_00975 [candidate division KSB1 bacterium]|nr:hypothetical protein [candidate division KSB1 bacterium]